MKYLKPTPNDIQRHATPTLASIDVSQDAIPNLSFNISFQISSSLSFADKSGSFVAHKTAKPFTRKEEGRGFEGGRKVF